MAAAEEAGMPAAGRSEPNHGLRVFLIWLPLAVIADWLLYFVYGPHMPPGTMSTSAPSQQFDIKVMSVLGAPVMLFVLVYSAYAMRTWRSGLTDVGDGPPLVGNRRVQVAWITVSTVIVLFLAGFGTYELGALGQSSFAGAGAGEGRESCAAAMHPVMRYMIESFDDFSPTHRYGKDIVRFWPSERRLGAMCG